MCWVYSKQIANNSKLKQELIQGKRGSILYILLHSFPIKNVFIFFCRLFIKFKIQLFVIIQNRICTMKISLCDKHGDCSFSVRSWHQPQGRWGKSDDGSHHECGHVNEGHFQAARVCWSYRENELSIVLILCHAWTIGRNWVHSHYSITYWRQWAINELSILNGMDIE